MQDMRGYGPMLEEGIPLRMSPNTIKIDQIGTPRAFDQRGKLIGIVTANTFRIEYTDQYTRSLVMLDQVRIVRSRVVQENQIGLQRRNI